MFILHQIRQFIFNHIPLRSITLIINCAPLISYIIYCNPMLNLTTLPQPQYRNTCGLLLKKYDNDFNFYVTKSINHIIYNRKDEQATLIAKDIAVLVEDIEYLKRYYFQTTPHGKNEINDRMALLINFYASANMLQYEYPSMVVTRTEEIFKKRRKKLYQVENSQEEDSSKVSNTDSKQIINQDPPNENEELQFLNEMDWSDIINYNLPNENTPTQKQSLQFDEEWSIYDLQPKQTDSFFSKINKLTSELAYEMNFDQHQNEREVTHLILDFDDLDRERIVKQYTKLTNKQNIPVNPPKVHNLKTSIRSLNDKKPLSSSITIDSYKQSTFKEKKQTAMNRQSMFIGSREERDKEVKVMKKSTHLEQNKRNFNFSQDMVINEYECEQSPLNEGTNDYNFAPIEQKSHYFNTESKKSSPPMKQSQILYNDYFIKEKYQNKQSHDFKLELHKLKENPFELKEILKIETTCEHEGEKKSKVFSKQSGSQFLQAKKIEVQRQKQHKNDLPFYLKRVKSHEELRSTATTTSENKIQTKFKKK